MVIKDTLKKVRYRTNIVKNDQKVENAKNTTLKVIRERNTWPVPTTRAKQKITFFTGKFTYKKDSHAHIFVRLSLKHKLQFSTTSVSYKDPMNPMPLEAKN